MIYLDGEYKEENVEMMAWKTVKGSYPDTEHVKFCTLPEVTVASCTYQGRYTRITDVYTAGISGRPLDFLSNAGYNNHMLDIANIRLTPCSFTQYSIRKRWRLKPGSEIEKVFIARDPGKSITNLFFCQSVS